MLHSPEFHVKERSLQNERVARIFERKNQYKTKASALNDQLATTSAKLDQVQRISNETCNEMSKTINTLQREVSELNGKLHDANAKNELEREAVQSLQGKATEKDLVVDKLNQKLDNANESIHNAAKESCESKSRVETIESQFTSYKEEKETQVNKLQQDLVKAESENASLSEQLATLSDKLESKVALLCKSTAELLDESRKDSNAQIDARSTLLGISTRSQQTHEVLLQVKEQKQVDIDEILRTIRSTMSEELQVLHANKLVPTKPSSDAFDGQNDEPEHRATAFVQNVLSEAFETTICT